MCDFFRSSTFQDLNVWLTMSDVTFVTDSWRSSTKSLQATLGWKSFKGYQANNSSLLCHISFLEPTVHMWSFSSLLRTLLNLFYNINCAIFDIWEYSLVFSIIVATTITVSDQLIHYTIIWSMFITSWNVID